MSFKVGDFVKHKYYGNSGLITSIDGPVAILRYRQNSLTLTVEELNKDYVFKDKVDQYGFKTSGYHVETETYVCPNGFFQSGIHRASGTKYTRDGFDRDGFDRSGFDRDGFDRDGFDRNGFDRNGFNGNGFDRDGFGRDGFDKDGFDKRCVHKITGTQYDPDGYVSELKWRNTIRSTTEQSNQQFGWECKDIYGEIDDRDNRLALKWARQEGNGEYSEAKMLSARFAEKVAVKFYTNLGFNVRDVSIEQTAGKSNEWILCDLILDNKIKIDVKNSRPPLNKKNTYIEHCVSKFKKDRGDQEVIIAGVISPYLNLEKIRNLDEYDQNYVIRCLGETTLSNLKVLENRFGKERFNFFEISIDGKNYIPRWAYEYSERFYKKRNGARLSLKDLEIRNLPSLAKCKQVGLNPIPAYFSSGIELPYAWTNELFEWQTKFYKRLKPPVTMPVLFLALLISFLEIIKDKSIWCNFNPNGYRQLIYDNVDRSYKDENPLGISDPLNVIDELIETLSILWDNKDIVNLDEFETFKFYGTGLLTGRRRGHVKDETILAYCGGFVDRKGKCGNSPLIIGKHDNCQECGKLICNICGYCCTSKYCSQCEDRMKKFIPDDGMLITQDNDLTNVFSAFVPDSESEFPF